MQSLNIQYLFFLQKKFADSWTRIEAPKGKSLDLLFSLFCIGVKLWRFSTPSKSEFTRKGILHASNVPSSPPLSTGFLELSTDGVKQFNS